MRSWLLAILGIFFFVGVAGVVVFQLNSSPSPQNETPAQFSSPKPGASGSIPQASASPALSPPDPQTSPSASIAAAPDLTMDSNGLSKATVVIATTQGIIKIKLYPKEAPKTVQRVIELIHKGFYNGLTFHRVVPGFVIQGGDPSGNGTGGSGQKLDAEFSQSLKHLEGSVAMARAADPNSADSQFYISLGSHPHLDQKYTIFGMVTEGIDVARKIKIGDKMTNVSLQ